MMKVSNAENRALLFSLNFGLVTLAGSVGSLFAGQLPALFGELLGVAPGSAAAYGAVLLTSVALSLLTLVPLALIQEPKTVPPAASENGAAIETPAAGAPAAKENLWRVALQPLTLRLAFPNLLVGLGAAILIPYMNLFFVERFALPDRQLGLLFGLSSLLTGVSSVLAPRLATGLGGKIRAVVFTQAASLGFLLLLGFSPFLWLVSLSFLLRSALMNMAVPLYHAFAMEQVPEREGGTVNSVIELGWQLGWAVGPYASGLVQASYGFNPLFVATSALYASATLLLWAFFRKAEARQLPAEPVGEETISLT
jgi:MFS family permease